MNNYLLNMTRRVLLIGMFLFCTIAGWAQTYQNGMRKGQIKVKFTSSMTATLGQMKVSARSSGLTTGIQTFDAAAKKASATNMYRLFPSNSKNENKLHKHGLDLWYIVEIKENVDPKMAIAQFKQLQEVAIAEPEYEKVLAPYTVTPYVPGASINATLPFNDPMLKDQWHYNNTSQSGFGDADVNLFEAWTTTAGANNIIVSVHDQGVDVNHKDLKGNIWVNQAELTGVPGIDDDNNGYIDDVNGYNFQKAKGAVDAEFHGTHVAGTIAAVNNNGIGVAGVAGGTGNGDGVKVMSLQIFGGLFENSYIYAADNGAVISQNSWGYTTTHYYDQSVKDAIDYFIAEAGDYPGSPMKGGLVIFAAGNENYDSEWYPGYFSNVMAVASIGPEWKKASYSNFGSWIEVSAPGGDQSPEYNAKSGVLSTLPKDQYGYLQGTSMACPHMSGIAALALANRTKQLTNTEVWNKLVTGVVSIDEYNPDFIGKMGSGAVDAALAIKNDQGIAPARITNLKVTGIAQEFATLTWSVPADNDDVKPISFQLYYHTVPITAANLNAATKATIKNEKSVGAAYEYEVNGLLGLTTYYFTITSTDRWGNASVLSEVISEKTNAGPSIAVDKDSESINLEIDIANSTSASHDIKILNKASGILRWNHLMRHSNTSLSFSTAGLNYPILKAKKPNSDFNIRRLQSTESKNQLRSNEAAPTSFTTVEKFYVEFWPLPTVGETDTAFTNSSATKFIVSEADGFNLTQVQAYLMHDPKKGPVIVEIYKGDTPTKNNLIFAQEHKNWGTDKTWAYVTLNEQLYFTSGETFWVVVHVPSGNLFPLGMGYELQETYSDNCYMSLNLGESWIPLQEAINDKNFAWAVVAASENATLGTYLTLEPGSGDVNGKDSTMTTLSADAATLINGSYNANIILTSNDATKKELRVPVSLTITGHQPNIKHIDISDFGSVFVGTEKTLELVLDNHGYGNFNDPVFTVNNAQFVIGDDKPWQIRAREEVILKITFMPVNLGNINDVLIITNGTQTYEIQLAGVGADIPKIVLSPQTQILNDISIGDKPTAQIVVENNGAYPLKYFIPGFDSKGISTDWPTDYHTYGYKVRSNQSAESDPIPYEFQDIKTTGVDITTELNSEYQYFALDMGFDFPYYGKKMQKLYVAQYGFTTFDNSINPVNVPSLGNSYNPRGFISPLGLRFSYVVQGQIFYQVEADRVIVQYDNVWDGASMGESITAQMVLFANGDIRFYYENMGFSSENQGYLNILIEDYDQQDGILVHDFENRIEMFNGLALGFDYPGPNIITKIENGSGIIPAGGSAEVGITMATDSLAEGIVNRFITFISNDPSNSQTNAVIQLDVNSGGIVKSFVSTDTIAFGNVFQGAVKSSVFTIKNTGTANVDITSMAFVNSDFTFVGDQPTSVKPGLSKKYVIQVPTSTLTTLEDWLSINYVDGTHDTVYVTAKVVDAPSINIDLSMLQQTLAYGDSISVPFTIKNPGLGTLEVAASGKEWLSFDVPTTNADDITYTYEKHNKGGVYQWIDIRKTGTQLPFWEGVDDTGFWNELTLPFPVEFYGEKYNSFKIGDNGIISFEEDPQATIFTDKVPTSIHPGACIMPYWTFGGFNTMFHAKEDVGIFYQYYDDKIIITWSYFINNFGGMGDPVSAQIIFYKNGTMKFQYKPEDGALDLTSQNTAIGLQKDSATGVFISDHLPLDHGDGLLYILVPSKKFSIAPNSTVIGAINLDARNVYGGLYNEMLKIQTNVPGSENLEKPIELTVSGDAVFVAEDVIDFEIKMVALEGGSPTIKTIDLKFKNDGAAAYEITWAQMADGQQAMSLQLYAMASGWMGPELRWADISELYYTDAEETPTFTIRPGDELIAHATFSPSMAGEFSDELIITTSMGEQRIVFKGKAVEPPVLHAIDTLVDVMMNMPTETADEIIAFDNIEGKSDLEYSISIDYHRSVPTLTNQTIVASSVSKAPLHSIKASGKSGARIQGVYNRTITHTESETPDTFLGSGGSTSITIATKYNSGPEGFSLSHIETWLRLEGLKSGKIEVEIRAGGTSIANAAPLTKGKLDFTGTAGADEVGKFFEVKMDEPGIIYPNEDFYVIVTYPLGIEYPQGAITNSETIADRYYYFDEGKWLDIQKIPSADFSKIGWLMFAAEEKAGVTSWLTITSATEGILASGASSLVDLHFDGALAQRGDNLATVIITSNDPDTSTVRIPVKLHMNEGPHFKGVQNKVIMSEMDTISLSFDVTDAEGHDYTLVPAQTYKGVKHTLTNGKLLVIVTPDYSDEGNYTYIFKATDQFNAISELTLTVEVMNANQTPAYIAEDETKTLEYNSIGKLFEYSLEEFFADPDEDAVIFSVISGDTDVADVFASSNQFMVRPSAMGETTLIFTITDSHGAVLRDTINVVVNNILGLEEEVSSSVKVYPNPVQQFAKVFLSYEWKGAVQFEIIDATGKQHLVQQVDATTSRDIQLNVSNLRKGFYVLRATSSDKNISIKLIKD